MKASEALRLALREMADPVCPRCRGAGVTGGDLLRDLCRCVQDRVPVEDGVGESPSDDPGTASAEEMPHPWDVIVRRAQLIQAIEYLGAAPDRWSG